MRKCKKIILRRGRVVPDFPVDGHILQYLFDSLVQIITGHKAIFLLGLTKRGVDLI